MLLKPIGMINRNFEFSGMKISCRSVFCPLFCFEDTILHYFLYAVITVDNLLIAHPQKFLSGRLPLNICQQSCLFESHAGQILQHLSEKIMHAWRTYSCGQTDISLFTTTKWQTIVQGEALVVLM